jgi:hypothetical protein
MDLENWAQIIALPMGNILLSVLVFADVSMN